MKRRDLRFRAGRSYIACGVTWTRHVNQAERRMMWTCRTRHPVRIVRNKFGRYFLSCRKHNLFATTMQLARAFRIAAVHMGYAWPPGPESTLPFNHKEGCQRNSACQCNV